MQKDNYVSYQGQAAITALENWGIPTTQAMQELAIAKQYGLNRLPIENFASSLTIKSEGGYFLIGGYFRGSRHPKAAARA